MDSGSTYVREEGREEAGTAPVDAVFVSDASCACEETGGLGAVVGCGGGECGCVHDEGERSQDECGDSRELHVCFKRSCLGGLGLFADV